MIRVSIKNSAGKRADGYVELQAWDQKQRSKRALKVLGLCWALSLITIVIPLAHFVLVPGFFIAGPISAWFFLNQHQIILGGQGTCPTCNEPLLIVRSPDRWPLTELCTKCRSSLTVEK